MRQQRYLSARTETKRSAAALRIYSEIAMPNDVKAALSVVFLVVAAILAYWHGSPIRPDFATYIMITAVFMVVAMWIFPEAGIKKDDVKKGVSRGRNG